LALDANVCATKEQLLLISVVIATAHMQKVIEANILFFSRLI